MDDTPTPPPTADGAGADERPDPTEGELGRELLRIETEADLRSVRALRRYRDRQRLRRPPKRFDLVWVAVPVVIGLAGVAITGPDPLWLIALAIGALYGFGEWRERRQDTRAAAAISDDPRRVLSFHEHGIVVVRGPDRQRLPWRGLDEVRRLDDAYLVLFHDLEPLYVPFEALGSDRRSGRLESLLASRDRLVQDG